MRQQLIDFTRPLRRQPRENVLQIGIRIMPVRLQVADFTLDFVQQLNVAQGLLGELAFVGDVQFEELATRMGHAADLGHAEFKAGLVTAKVIAD